MKNGRCDIHGGKTPSGRQWHVPQYADPSTPHGERKFNRKLREQKKYAEKRKARLATMTPDERARHDAWHRTHRPGAGAARSAERERMRQNSEAQVLFAEGPSLLATDPESVRVRTALAAAKAKLAVLEIKNTNSSSDDEEGIFS